MKAQYLIIAGFRLPITEINISTEPEPVLLSGYVSFYIPYGIDIKDFESKIVDLVKQRRRISSMEVETTDYDVSTLYRTKVNNVLITSISFSGKWDEYYNDWKITFDCTDFDGAIGSDIFVETVDLID